MVTLQLCQHLKIRHHQVSKDTKECVFLFSYDVMWSSSVDVTKGDSYWLRTTASAVTLSGKKQSMCDRIGIIKNLIVSKEKTKSEATYYEQQIWFFIETDLKSTLDSLLLEDFFC